GDGGHRLDVALEYLVGEGVDADAGPHAVGHLLRLVVAQAVADLGHRVLADHAADRVGVHEHGRTERVHEAGRLPEVALDAGHHRLVDLRVHEHVPQVGDAHELLAFLDGLALGDDRLLATHAAAALFADVVNHHAVLGGRDQAAADLLLDVVVLVFF